jgi:HAD superfamily hydrolase (TIGR01509 family)
VTRSAQAVLFDMDGTLVDSEKLWDIGLRELAAQYGGALSDATRHATVGVATEQAVPMLLEDLGVPLTETDSAKRLLTDRVIQLFAMGLEWRPGARELIAAVRRAGLRTALVTNTERRLVDVALGSLSVGDFDAVICGDEVPHTKPHPAPYALAAAALGLAPGVCVAIEDSPSGVRSALAAGCAVVAVPNEVPIDINATLIVTSLVDLDVSTLRALTDPAGNHKSPDVDLIAGHSRRAPSYSSPMTSPPHSTSPRSAGSAGRAGPGRHHAGPDAR